MIERHYGTTRVAIIVAKKLVFKFPHCRTMSLERRWKILQFLRGCVANLTEMYTYWFTKKADFLVPVMSFGLVNLQLFEHGECPSEEEMNEHVWSKLSKNANGLRAFMNPHELYRNNWRKNERGGIA